MWKLQSVFALFHPAHYCQITFIKTDTAALGWGGRHLVFFNSNQALCFLPPRSVPKAVEQKPATHSGPFLRPRLR